MSAAPAAEQRERGHPLAQTGRVPAEDRICLPAVQTPAKLWRQCQPRLPRRGRRGPAQHHIAAVELRLDLGAEMEGDPDVEFGWNGRMDAIQAAVLRVKLAHLADWDRSRQQHAAMYDRLLAEAGLISRASSSNTSSSGSVSSASDSPLRLLARSPEAKHVFHQYVIRAKRRDELRKFLADHKIGSEVYCPLPLHLQPVFSYLGLSGALCRLRSRPRKKSWRFRCTRS